MFEMTAGRALFPGSTSEEQLGLIFRFVSFIFSWDFLIVGASVREAASNGLQPPAAPFRHCLAV